MKQVFADACAAVLRGVAYDRHATVEDFCHGRHEERYVTVIHDPKGLPADWPDARAVVQVNREREANGTNVTTTHYYVSSHRGTAETMAFFARKIWGRSKMACSIGVPDVMFREEPKSNPGLRPR